MTTYVSAASSTTTTNWYKQNITINKISWAYTREIFQFIYMIINANIYMFKFSNNTIGNEEDIQIIINNKPRIFRGKILQKDDINPGQWGNIKIDFSELNFDHQNMLYQGIEFLMIKNGKAFASGHIHTMEPF